MKNIILLHGALGSASQMTRLADELSNEFNVHTPDFDGHGKNTKTLEFSIEHFAQNLIDFVEEHELKGAPVFGYSMGGYVALTALSIQPGIVGKVFTLGTKFGWTPEFAAGEVKMLNPDKIEEKVPKFAGYLASQHGSERWKDVMGATTDMMTALGNKHALTENEFKVIPNRVKITVGEEDKMVTREESEHIAGLLPNATFEQIAGFPHPIEKIDLSVLANRVSSFLQD